MSFIIPEELRFPTSKSKPHIEQCGKIFSTELEKSISNVLSKANVTLDFQIKDTKSFHEKQLLNDLKKRFSLNIGKIATDFRNSIEVELANQLSLDKRLHGKPIWWQNIITLDKTELTYKDSLERFKSNLGDEVCFPLEDLKKRVSCLIGEEQNLFGVDVIIRSLSTSLKTILNNSVSVGIALDIISKDYKDDLRNIVSKLNSYLIKNNVLTNIEEYNTTLTDIKKLPKSYGWENDGGSNNENLERKTVSRHSNYGSIAIPVDLTLPNLDEFLSGSSTILEEKKIAVPKFEPSVENKTVKTSNNDNNKYENDINQVKVKEKSIDDTWGGYIDKSRRIIDIQKKNYKPIDYKEISIVSNYEAEIKVTESNLIKNSVFVNETQDLQKNIRRIDFFDDGLDRLDINIFSETIKNEEIKSDMSAYDLYIVKVLEKLFSSIINNPEYSLNIKSIFYKLQIPFWHRILLDKSFLMSKNTPSRILFDLLLSTEIIFNERCADFAEKIISKASYRLRKSSEYFSLLVENIIDAILKNNEQEDSEIQKASKGIEISTNETVIYNNLKNEVESNITIRYEPLASFVYKIWLCGFIKTFYISGNNTSLPLDVDKELPSSAKLCWQQSLGTFESLNWICQNKSITNENLIHTKDLFLKVNLIMPKICMETGIDINYSKALIALIKYRTDTIFKTSNPIAIKEMFGKIKENEETYIEAGDSYYKSTFGDRVITSEDYSNKLSNHLKLNSWYNVDGDKLKLKYCNKNYTKIIFIKGDELRKLVEKSGIKTVSEFDSGAITEITQSITRSFLGLLSNANMKLMKDIE